MVPVCGRVDCTGGEYFAIQDIYLLDGGELANRELGCEAIICLRHGEWFSIKTGPVLGVRGRAGILGESCGGQGAGDVACLVDRRK